MNLKSTFTKRGRWGWIGGNMAAIGKCSSEKRPLWRNFNSKQFVSRMGGVRRDVSPLFFLTLNQCEFQMKGRSPLTILSLQPGASLDEPKGACNQHHSAAILAPMQQINAWNVVQQVAGSQVLLLGKELQCRALNDPPSNRTVQNYWSRVLLE